MRGHEPEVNSIVKIWSCSDDSTVGIWNTNSGKCIEFLNDVSRILKLAVFDKKFLITILRTFLAHSDNLINDILVLSNGNIVSCADNVNTKVWEFNSVIQEGQHQYGIENVNYLIRAENNYIICCSWFGSCKLYSTNTGNCVYESRNVGNF